MAVRAAGNMAPVSSAITQEDALDWVKKDKRRMLHVVYRVGDLDRTIKFYTECLGMKLLRKRDIPEERYTNAFLGYGPEDSHFVIELTYNYGVDQYDVGAGFGHFGVAVEDVAKTVDLIKAKGGKVTREPGPVKGGRTVIAFIEDPDGYKFELLERGPTPEPLCQVMLRVARGGASRWRRYVGSHQSRNTFAHRMADLSSKTYPSTLSRRLTVHKPSSLQQITSPRDKPRTVNHNSKILHSANTTLVHGGVTHDTQLHQYTIAMMGYGPEDKNAVLELTYNYGVTEYDKGNGYAQIAIGTDDVYKTAEVIKLSEGKVTREPGPLPGINTKITACVDPDGWKTV
ncbi:glyoxalase/bleomycin resistance protein/dioxygenase superfamily protein [Actinidia rufa]|uniref:lactoylglutathione lyase n=1 Tax=Actinidia rufa TaxID=165716 RepID=A0A7J0DRU7_9ERIC|nr:glyoxalase/bleomycin resistance protein/dioxygenase superfamily protein [Actinidia rufa]